eukprot:5493991-Pleurochrysis_carterae.AAC.1
MTAVLVLQSGTLSRTGRSIPTLCRLQISQAELKLDELSNLYSGPCAPHGQLSTIVESVGSLLRSAQSLA